MVFRGGKHIIYYAPLTLFDFEGETFEMFLLIKFLMFNGIFRVCG